MTSISLKILCLFQIHRNSNPSICNCSQCFHFAIEFDLFTQSHCGTSFWRSSHLCFNFLTAFQQQHLLKIFQLVIIPKNLIESCFNLNLIIGWQCWGFAFFYLNVFEDQILTLRSFLLLEPLLNNSDTTTCDSFGAYL